jgi:hypothetical protein
MIEMVSVDVDCIEDLVRASKPAEILMNLIGRTSGYEPDAIVLVEKFETLHWLLVNDATT